MLEENLRKAKEEEEEEEGIRRKGKKGMGRKGEREWN